MRKSAQRKPKAKSKRARQPDQGGTQRAASLCPASLRHDERHGPQQSGHGADRASPRNQARRGQTSSAKARTGHAGRVVARRSLALNSMLRAGTDGTRNMANRIARLAGGARARVATLALPREDREVWALLLAPFLILALAIAGNQSFQLRRHLEALIARPVPPMILPATQIAARTVSAVPADAPSISGNRSAAHPIAAQPMAMVDGRHQGGNAARDSGPGAALAATAPETRRLVLSHTRAARSVQTPDLLGAPDARTMTRIALAGPAAAARTIAEPQTTAIKARLATIPDTTAPRTLALLDPSQLSSIAAIDDTPAHRRGFASLDDRCALPTGEGSKPVLVATTTGKANGATARPADFGVRLARAAQTQLSDLVIYDDKYRSISYPLGDVPKLYGVCTDVLIRAYREVGIDLQVAVQKARVGSGDRNIDHRRTETLRRFFAREGSNLPVTSFAEDYLPGDIVTYTRPQNTGTSSRSHIAMVSDVIAPSGRPMILHNRGWGPQLEDGLFVDKITGHYRFDGQYRSTTPQHAELAPPVTTAAVAAPIGRAAARVMQKPHVRLLPAGQRRQSLAAPLGQEAPRGGPRRGGQNAARTVDSAPARNTAHR